MKGIPAKASQRLASNLFAVRERMVEALAAAGRAPDAARLVAVTKSVPAEVAWALLDLGQRDLGESRPEIALPKALALGKHDPAPVWHMIGRYQTRKIRDSLPMFTYVHSVHDLRLLERLAARASADRELRILLQVNVAGEAAKQGFRPDETEAALEHAERSAKLSVQGLMTMAPAGRSSDQLRRVFADLRILRDRLATPERPLQELSMGMSDDFEEALREGATLIRVGTALYSGVLER
ncbi:MAG: YggS family pyridoxal phosphate-dependent enzyme [Planctomycetes bacterium]|jgi:hypothetical protein|nr:YggS family pyridoxal phosphate-dependent enzyme [Planctomycetota bacterium]